MNTQSRHILFVMLSLFVSIVSLAQEQVMTLHLKDGTSLRGRIVTRVDSTSQGNDSLRVDTPYGILMVPASHIASVSAGSTSAKGQGGSPEAKDSAGEDRYPLKRHWSEGGSSLVSGLVSLSLASESGSSLTSLSVASNYVRFVARSLGIGFDANFSVQASGGASVTAIGVGPKLMVTFGSKEKTAYPYLDLGVDYLWASQSLLGYYSSNVNHSSSGSMVRMGAGIMTKIGENVGVPFELGVAFTSVENRQSTTFTFGVGLAGLFY